ncbi:MAG: hypothetical protein JST58_11460 [Bacteroidetes bacterium]|nr:hypothetical protein [Bacteroidota bacterium]
MGRQAIISTSVLSAMRVLLENEQQAGKIALPQDLHFMENGSWLRDAAVIDWVIFRRGTWEVSLVFAQFNNPLQFIIRNITQCFSEQKAKTAAFFIRKEAAKDRRGPLQVSIQDLQICFN